MNEPSLQTTSQCPTCDEKDVITIAGKTFCASCGTPYIPSSGAASTPVSTGSSASVSPSLSVSATAPKAEPMPRMNEEPHPIAAPTSQTPPISAAPPVPETTIGPASTAGTITPETNSSTEPMLTSPDKLTIKPAADELHTTVATADSANISKFTPLANGGIATISSSGLDSENSNSEIKSLSDKADETVMSDEALDALASPSKSSMPPVVSSSTPMPSTQPSPVNSPAAAPVSSIAPAPVAPVAASPQPLVSSTEPLPLPATNNPVIPAPISAPVESSYKLDLTSSKSATLPKAMSDIRPASSASAGTATVAPAQAQPAPPNPVSQATTPDASPIPPANPISSPAPVAPPVNPISQPITPVSPATTMQSLVMDQPAAQPTTGTSTPAPIKAGVKASSVALSIVGLLLVGAYIWQVNYPNLALKVAGSRAGISANFPGYVPNGYKLSGNILSAPGNISYNIATPKGDKKLAVTEVKTDWDSQALAENYVSQKSPNYLALQAQGLTIYLYGDNQASWVNNGNWYKLEGANTGLSQDQLIKVATSL